MNLALVAGAAAASVAAVHGATFLIARRIGRYNIVDIAWGIGFVAIAAVAAAVGSGDLFRRFLLLGLVAVWGLRLAGFLYVRSRGQGEDQRYRDLLKGRLLGRHRAPQDLRRAGRRDVVCFSAVAAFGSVGADAPVLLPLMAVGVLVWAVGLTFEAVGDHQMRAFKSDPANRGVIMDRGLWAWTRHPNYFGDAAIWWGLWLVSIASWLSVTTVLSPVLMTYLLAYVTGGRLTERYMRHRPGFAEYCSRTSFFVPRPPRRGQG